jgi:CRISPR-associated exonuclease Cas4
MYSEDELLPLSALQHVIFCPRRAALVHVEGVWDENRLTMQGRILHGRTHIPGTESRVDVRIARGLSIRSLRLGVSGKADVVEFHRLPEWSPEVVTQTGLPAGTILPGIEGL